MNAKSFKTVFSKRLGTLVAVGEHASNQGKANGACNAAALPYLSWVGAAVHYLIAPLTLCAGLAGMACAQTLSSTALPTGAQVSAGSASVSSAGAAMTITQASDRAAINWQSFNIGQNASVTVAQPSSSSVLLNRIGGDAPSQILGRLSANGQIVLVNPNGITFGKDGSVSASGLTASTLGISDADFMAGNMKFSRNGASGAIVNQGELRAAPGGYVALLGAVVSNEGKISTPQGNTYLAAAEAVKMPVTGSGRIKLELSPSAMAAAVSNSGTIVTEGGQVFMQASAAAGVMASVLQTGSIDTSGEQGGKVTLLADGGDIRVSGSITANSTGKNDQGQTRAGGDIVIGRDEATGVLAATSDVSGARLQSKGGFIETSGRYLTADGVSIQAATWLIDPDNIDITGDATPATVGYSKIKASDIAAALNSGTSVTISTTSGVSPNSLPYTASNPNGEGNIVVNEAIAKTTGGDASLTLTADNGLTVNRAITSSSGTLNINLTANGRTNGTAVASMTTTERALSRGLFVNASTLNANGGDITLTGTSYADSSTTNNANASATNAIGKGVQIHNGSSLSGKNITITGDSETLSGATGYGVMFQRYPSPAIVSATGNIAITGTLQGAGDGRGLTLETSGWGAEAARMTAGGNLTLRGNNRASTSNVNEAVYIASGLQAMAGGNIVLQAETNNPGTNAINVISNYATSWGTPNTGAINGNMTLQATGDVLIQSNTGGIALNNQLPNTLTSGSLTSENKITGRNVTIDNTGAGMATGAGTGQTGTGGTQGATLGSGSINPTTGAIAKGSGQATGGIGINLADNRAITATGNVNIYGKTFNQYSKGTYTVRSAANITAANFSIQADGFIIGNSTPEGGGLLLVNGSSITGTATSGSNLLQGTWSSLWGPSSSVKIGDSASSTVTLIAASGSTLAINGTNTASEKAASFATYGIFTQGTVNTQGAMSLTGSSIVNHGIYFNGALNHSGGALSLNGSAKPNQSFDSNKTNPIDAGVYIGKELKVIDASNLAINGSFVTTVGASQDATATGYGVFTSGTGLLTGNGGTLSITGTAALPEVGTTKTQGIYAGGAISGWGSTALLGQNAASSSLAAVQLASNINVGANALSILANGGQIFQGSASTLTAGRVTIDNTGAGRTSLFADPTATLNIANGASFGGSIAADGTVTAGSRSAAITSGAGVNLTGAVAASGHVAIQGASSGSHGVSISRAITSSGGKITIGGDSTASLASSGVLLTNGTNTINAFDTLTITGNSNSSAGVNVGGDMSGKSIDVTGTSYTQSTNLPALPGVQTTGTRNFTATNGNITLFGKNVLTNRNNLTTSLVGGLQIRGSTNFSATHNGGNGTITLKGQANDTLGYGVLIHQPN